MTSTSVYVLIFMVLLCFVCKTSGQSSLCEYDGIQSGLPLTFDMLENETAGYIVGLIKVNGDDADISLLLEDSTGIFELRSPFGNHTRELALVKDMAVWIESDKDTYNSPVRLTIDCQAKHGPQKLDIQIDVYVDDINNKVPYFTGAPYETNVSELVEVGTTLITVNGADDDYEHPNNFLYYSLVPGLPYSDYLKLSHKDVILAKKLDYRVVTTLTVMLKIQDGGTPPLWSFTNLTVNVIDEDNLNPVFIDDPYDSVVLYNASVGTQLDISPNVIYALDQDTGINSPILYSFPIESQMGGKFQINEKTGVVTVSGELVRNTEYFILIQAMEEFNRDRYSTASLHVTVEGINDNAPSFDYELYPINVMENAPVGTTVLRVSATDADGSDVTYNLLAKDGDELVDFSMTAGGLMKTTSHLDASIKSLYEFIAIASDGKFTDEASIEVTVVKTNNKNPVFTQSTYQFSSNRTEGIMIGLVEAFDPTDSGALIEYSIVGYKEYFEINDKGEIFTTNMIKNLLLESCEFSVMACNRPNDALGEQQRCSVAETVVTLPSFGATHEPVQDPKTAQFSIIIILAVIAGIMFIVILLLAVFLIRQLKRTDNETPQQPGRLYHNPANYDLAIEKHEVAGNGNGKGKGIGNGVDHFEQYYGNYNSPSPKTNSTDPDDNEGRSSLSDQSDQPVDSSSREQLYKDRNKNKLNEQKIQVAPAAHVGHPNGMANGQAGKKKHGKHVTIGMTEEVDDWGGEHPQSDTQIETMLDPNVSVEPLNTSIRSSDSNVDQQRPELTIYF